MDSHNFKVGSMVYENRTEGTDGFFQEEKQYLTIKKITKKTVVYDLITTIIVNRGEGGEVFEVNIPKIYNKRVTPKLINGCWTIPEWNGKNP